MTHTADGSPGGASDSAAGGEPEIAIRPEPATSPAARACVDAYYRELEAIFPDGFDPGASSVVDFDGLTPPDGQFLVLDREGEALGCGAVRVMADRSTAEIKRMWVDGRLRGGGHGARLLHALEAEARKLGCTRARLDTARYLTAAIAMYRAHGYREIPAYNDNIYAHLWFEKDLGAADTGD